MCRGHSKEATGLEQSERGGEGREGREQSTRGASGAMPSVTGSPRRAGGCGEVGAGSCLSSNS